MEKRIVSIEGKPMASVREDGKFFRVDPFPACSVGDYFLILTWMQENGYRVR